MAILMGSVIIACGLYFGLRNDNRGNSGNYDGQPARPIATSSVDQPALVQPAKPLPSVDKTRVIREAAIVLGTHKKSLTEKCLAPSLAKKPDPPNVKYTFNITFDAAGNIVARGVMEDRATSRPEVLECINDNFPVVRLPPLGQTVLVDVPFELP